MHVKVFALLNVMCTLGNLEPGFCITSFAEYCLLQVCTALAVKKKKMKKNSDPYLFQLSFVQLGSPTDLLIRYVCISWLCYPQFCIYITGFHKCVCACVLQKQ